MGFQDLESALRFDQISAEKQQDASMARRKRWPSIKASAGAGCVGVIVDRRMSRFIRLTGTFPKALIGISSAGVQHGEPGERREVHRSRNLAFSHYTATPVSVSGTISTGHLVRFKTPSATLPRKR